jgi:hypothetical protein
MDFKRALVVGSLVVISLIAGWVFAVTTVVTIKKTTELRFELQGGFAYVNSPVDNMVEVAYLKETNVENCKVPQPGTNLNIIRGTIVSIEPASLSGISFDVTGSKIELGASEDTGGPISTKPNHPPAPDHPANTNSETDWNDSRWVPYVSPDYPTSSLNPNWRTMVDGRLVLRGGRLTGSSPSRVLARELMWEWRTNDGLGTKYQQSITDTAVYKAHIKGATITLTLTNAKSGLTKLELKPLIPGDPVVLQLEGRHDMTDPPPQPGDKLKHFCAFYQLMQPVPEYAKQYMPYLLASGVVGSTGATGGNPSPGYYCPGDGF